VELDLYRIDLDLLEVTFRWLGLSIRFHHVVSLTGGFNRGQGEENIDACILV